MHRFRTAKVRKESNVLPEWEQWGMEIVYGDINFPDHHEAIFKSASAALWVPPTTKGTIVRTRASYHPQTVGWVVTFTAWGAG